MSNDGIDTFNQYGVGITGNRITVLNMKSLFSLRPDQALNLAAWLVVIADPTGKEFPKVLEAVKNT